MKKSNKKGFTLVELVVVIAIIGVLAAILVPSMMTYVKKSRLKTANSNAKTAYNAVATYIADEEIKGNSINLTTGQSIACDKTTATSGLSKVLVDAMGENGDSAGIAYVVAAKINGKVGTPVVQWAKTKTDSTIGQYPNPIEYDEMKSYSVLGGAIKGSDAAGA